LYITKNVSEVNLSNNNVYSLFKVIILLFLSNGELEDYFDLNWIKVISSCVNYRTFNFI